MPVIRKLILEYIFVGFFFFFSFPWRILCAMVFHLFVVLDKILPGFVAIESPELPNQT